MSEFEKAMRGEVFFRGDETLALLRDKARDLCFDYNQLRPSQLKERKVLLKELMGSVKENYTILSPFQCDYGKFIEVGENFFANMDLKILDGGKVKFGDDVMIGPNCTFITVNHMIDPQERLAGMQVFKDIEVGNNVWFGAGVMVLPGVKIGDNSVIAAGSLVTKDIEANVLAMGSPCKAVRKI